MISSHPVYASASLRNTKRQESYDQLNNTILSYAKATKDEWEAETLWLAMRAEGQTLSQTTFYNRLKKIVESGLIVKRQSSVNKNLYHYEDH